MNDIDVLHEGNLFVSDSTTVIYVFYHMNVAIYFDLV